MAPRKFTTPVYETRFIKISLQVKNGHLAVHIYTHMYRKDLVFLAFPAEAPAHPESLAGDCITDTTIEQPRER